MKVRNLETLEYLNYLINSEMIKFVFYFSSFDKTLARYLHKCKVS